MMSFGRMKRHRWEGELEARWREGRGQSLTKSSSASDPQIMSGDLIRRCRCYEFCVVWVMWLSWLPLLLDQGSSHHKQAGRAARNPLRSESWGVCLFDCCDFHSPSPAGGHNNRRFTETGPLSGNCPKSVWEYSCSPHGPTAPALWIFDACCEMPGVKFLLILTIWQIGPNRKSPRPAVFLRTQYFSKNHPVNSRQ